MKIYSRRLSGRSTLLLLTLVMCYVSRSCLGFHAESRAASLTIHKSPANIALARVEHNCLHAALPEQSSSTESTASKRSTNSLSTYSSSVVSWENWWVTHMDAWYNRSMLIKCPFWKRRVSDVLDQMHCLMRFLSIRHKSLDILGPPPGCRGLSQARAESQVKLTDLSIEERLSILECNDWKPKNNKGYYITGRLTAGLYKDDCIFDGPDPDMPVKGVRKYVNAASHLFDHATSTAELESIRFIDDDAASPKIVAHWKLQGILQLPWKPPLPTWTGTTTYYLDPDDGLIYRHKEAWDISVLQAFGETLFPEVASKIWRRTDT